MKRIFALICVAAVLSWAGVVTHSERAAGAGGFNVVPFEFDPNGTHLVGAGWKAGLGCPTNIDPACPTGDPQDTNNEGLFMAKTGPTNNDASAGAAILGVKGVLLTELGYDLRKPGNDPSTISDPRGSHCGAGAPRFNITSGGHLYFIGCASPPPTMDTPLAGGMGWQRLRWGGGSPLLAFSNDGGCPGNINPCNITGFLVDNLSIVFDEGQDTGPDNFGFAILDNIDVDGTLVGRGPDK
jgi:hypothetical protein